MMSFRQEEKEEKELARVEKRRRKEEVEVMVEEEVKAEVEISSGGADGISGGSKKVTTIGRKRALACVETTR